MFYEYRKFTRPRDPRCWAHPCCARRALEGHTFLLDVKNYQGICTLAEGHDRRSGHRMQVTVSIAVIHAAHMQMSDTHAMFSYEGIRNTTNYMASKNNIS